MAYQRAIMHKIKVSDVASLSCENVKRRCKDEIIPTRCQGFEIGGKLLQRRKK